MQLSSPPRRYTLHITQQTQALEPFWQMHLFCPDMTLLSTATKRCTRSVLVDGFTALACALPGIVIYDEPRNRAA